MVRNLKRTARGDRWVKFDSVGVRDEAGSFIELHVAV